MGKSSEEIADIALRDGVGYAIHCINADEIEDPELRQKWREAADLLKQIGRILTHAITEDGYEYERPL